jgi:hypothetical protein
VDSTSIKPNSTSANARLIMPVPPEPVVGKSAARSGPGNGRSPTVGACCTTTSKVVVSVLPAASLALHVTIVDPTANNDPLAGRHDICSTVPELSLTVGSV